MIRTKHGFTYIEIMITLIIMSIVFVPLMRMISVNIEQVGHNTMFITAANLARAEIESLKSRNLTEKQIALEGDRSSAGIKLNGSIWRVERHVSADTDPLKVEVTVYADTEPDKPVITLTTLIEDLW